LTSLNGYGYNNVTGLRSINFDPPWLSAPFKNYQGKFFTTTTETSQNSSKWSQLTTDHRECIDLCIRPLQLKLLSFEKSLISDIFANIKTKITLFLSATHFMLS
jgi:hypothetical protein